MLKGQPGGCVGDLAHRSDVAGFSEDAVTEHGLRQVALS